MKKLYGVLFTSGVYTFEGKYWAVYKNYDEYDKTLKGGSYNQAGQYVPTKPNPNVVLFESRSEAEAALKVRQGYIFELVGGFVPAAPMWIEAK
jgi:hypothetical protein